MDEQIEGAYADLYGYDPRIQDLFTGVIERLRQVDALIFAALVEQTQEDILSLKQARPPFTSAMLGNLLRATSTSMSLESHKHMEAIVGAFREEMVKLVRASDEEIEARETVVASSIEALPKSLERITLGRGRVVLEQSDDRCIVKLYPFGIGDPDVPNTKVADSRGGWVRPESV
jgi:hypothetical protein